MQRIPGRITLGLRSACPVLFAVATLGCGSGRTVGVTINENAAGSRNFVCVPAQGVGEVSCNSAEAFHTPDRPFDLTGQIKQECEYGVAKIWIESTKGDVTRVQFQCAAGPVSDTPTDELPTEEPPTEAMPAEPATATGSGDH